MIYFIFCFIFFIFFRNKSPWRNTTMIPKEKEIDISNKKTTDKIRRFINMQYVKIKRTAAVGSMVILALNLSFSIYPFIKHRNIHPYIAIPFIFIAVVFILWLAAHIYVKKTKNVQNRILSRTCA